MNKPKGKLYRKENKKALNYHGDKGGDFRHSRNTKAMKQFEGGSMSIKKDVQRGVDYTPLFKFLLSKVGKVWDHVYSEAIGRLDKKEPIFWMVYLHHDMGETDVKDAIVRIGDNSYYSKLTVNQDGLLVKVNPDITKELLVPSCSCCTHTFNGEVYS